LRFFREKTVDQMTAQGNWNKFQIALIYTPGPYFGVAPGVTDHSDKVHGPVLSFPTETGRAPKKLGVRKLRVGKLGDVTNTTI
jgi:hypothetical protein